ncbi:MAG: agmatine deiminase family protein [Acidimicrobiales bacterium]|jgi:agmatine deiminase
MPSDDTQVLDADEVGRFPAAAGFRMPAEWGSHQRCLIAWPSSARTEVWSDYYLLAQASYAAVARAIAAFEPVVMVARPADAGAARSYCGSDIEVLEMPIDDSFLRDSGPIFLVDSKGGLAAANFRFNSWGERYLPYDLDATIAERLCEYFGVRRFPVPMVLEGGSITVDGEGTLITTESCLLNPNRNPDLTKEKIEQHLMDYLGVTKVIWLKAGLGIDEDPDTDGHVDGVAFFTGVGRVVLHMVRDPQHPDFENFLENRRRLETTDARGRELEVIELDARSQPVMLGGVSIVENYINGYFANGGLVVPTAGTSDDARALEQLQAIVPDREVVGVPSTVVAYGGGGIHCITQQMP